MQDTTEITPKLTHETNRYFNSNSCYVPKRFGKGAEKMHISAKSQQHDSHWPTNRGNLNVHGQPIP